MMRPFNAGGRIKWTIGRGKTQVYRLRGYVCKGIGQAHGEQYAETVNFIYWYTSILNKKNPACRSRDLEENYLSGINSWVYILLPCPV